MSKLKKPTILVLSGGTVKGITFLGAIKYLEEKNILANINKLMTDNSTYLTNLLQNLETLSSELVIVTTKIDTMLQQNDLALNSMIRHLDSSVVESQNLLRQTQNSLKSLDNMITSNSSTY